MFRLLSVLTGTALSTGIAFAGVAHADCSHLPSHAALTAALQGAVKASGGPSNGGLDRNLWATVVDGDGRVCAVTFSGKEPGAEWHGSRVASAQKANTANMVSLDGIALSTTNIYSLAQPGGVLFGLQLDNRINTAVVYAGDAATDGTPRDGMVGHKVGGVSASGGGLALYRDGKKIGALGVDGDTSCANHNAAWRVRHALELGEVPAGVSANRDDGAIYDIRNGQSPSGFGHPACSGNEINIARQIKAGG